MPVQRDWLIILLSGQETLPVISFNSFDDISSYPELDLGFNWPIILAISVGLVYWNKKELEQCVLRYESKGALFAVLIERARSGPMIVKYSLNLLAMIWAPDTYSFSLRKYAGNVDLLFFLLYPPYPKDRGMLWFYVEAALPPAARRPPPAARRPPPAARNGVNAITQKPLDGLFSNLVYTLVVIVSWPD